MQYKILTVSITILILTGMLSGSAAAGWLIYHKPEFRGKVIDAETKEPIEGAVVVAIYNAHPIISGPAGGSAYIIKIKETLTDEKGEFYFPAYTTIIQPLSIEDVVDFIIYKPGYGSYPGREIYPFNYVGPEYLFSKKLGTKEEVRRGTEIVTITHGVVELPALRTWEERRKASMISISGGISKNKWPLLNELIEKEGKWLERNKGWRIEAK